MPVRGARPSADQREKKLLVIEKAGKVLFWQRPAESERNDQADQNVRRLDEHRD